MMRPLYYLLALCGLIALAISVADAAVPVTSGAVIDRMVERNPSLESFTTRVHVSMHMLNFPYLSPDLDGTAYYKRPDNFEVVFDRVPGYAKGFEKLFNDVGDPVAWEHDWNIGVSNGTLDDRPMIVLTMTKKVHSTILDHATAFIDPASYELPRMEWHYTSGGTVVMRQWYRKVGSYSLISQQHVEIDIPHVRAVGDSQYATYQTNVAVDNSVFKKP